MNRESGSAAEGPQTGSLLRYVLETRQLESIREANDHIWVPSSPKASLNTFHGAQPYTAAGTLTSANNFTACLHHSNFVDNGLACPNGLVASRNHQPEPVEHFSTVMEYPDLGAVHAFPLLGPDWQVMSLLSVHCRFVFIGLVRPSDPDFLSAGSCRKHKIAHESH